MTWALPTVSGMAPQVRGVASLSSKQILSGVRLQLSQHSTPVHSVAQRCSSVRCLASRGYSDNGYGSNHGYHSSVGYRQVSTSALASVSCCFIHFLLPTCINIPKIAFVLALAVPRLRAC